ncbi:MAG: Hsp20/alpha crystallin family protein [Chloroflexi bacterium]|nr:Hsp20/alpha crystallin family protein [Chloroflexota bacterium]
MVARWDPFSEMVTLRDAMSRLVNESFVRPGPQWGTAGAVSPFPFDMCESADDVKVRVALPGIDPNQLELTITQGVLTLKGYRTFYSGDQEKQYTWHVRGLGEGNFQFAVALPTTVDAEHAEADYDAGILTIRLPKAETVKARRIEIKGAQQQQAIEAGTR